MFVVFFFQNESTFPLVRKDYYKETIQGGLNIDQGISLDQVQENETSYIAFRTNYLM